MGEYAAFLYTDLFSHLCYHSTLPSKLWSRTTAHYKCCRNIEQPAADPRGLEEYKQNIRPVTTDG